MLTSKVIGRVEMSTEPIVNSSLNRAKVTVNRTVFALNRSILHLNRTVFSGREFRLRQNLPMSGDSVKIDIERTAVGFHPTVVRVLKIT